MGVNGGLFFWEAAKRAGVEIEVISRWVRSGKVKTLPDKYYSPNTGRSYTLIDARDFERAMEDGLAEHC